MGCTDVDTIDLTLNVTQIGKCIELVSVASDRREKLLRLHPEVPQPTLFQSLSGRSPQDQALEEKS